MTSEPAPPSSHSHRLQISFNWKIAIGILILFSVFIRLGFWQLDRAQQKKQIQNERHIRSQVPVSIESLALDDRIALKHRKVIIEGSYDNDKSILVNNQVFQGRPGFEVITLFKLHSRDDIVLVSRGWLPTKPGFKELPEIRQVTGPRQLVGEIYLPSEKQFFLPQKIDQPPKWPLTLHHFDNNTINQLVDKPVFPFVVRLDKNNPGVLERHWKITRLKPMNSISYAIQWFGMALFLVIISFIKSTNILEIMSSKK